MKAYPKSILSFLLIITIVSSCKEPEPVEIRNVKFKNLTTKGDNVEINTALSVFNPNSFGATVDEANLTIFINEKEVGKINDIEEFSLPGKKESAINLDVKLKASLVQNILKKEVMKLFTGKDLKLIIRGDVNAKMGVLSKRIPVEHSEDIKDMIKDLL